MSDRLTTLAMLWSLERCDGIMIGLTDHDRDLTIGGWAYRAAPGMVPAAIERGDGLDPVVSEARGALTAAAVSGADLLAGRWDGARVRVAAVDWDGGGEPVVLSEGTMGTVDIEAGGFTAELHGPAAALDRPATEETSAECRAMLGDRRCRVAMAGRERLARVIASAGAVITLDRTEPVPDAYGGGTVRWLGGALCGGQTTIAGSDGAQVTLTQPPRGTIAAGTLVRLREGCDKSIATCAARFGNAANFRGEPYLPGMDLLTRYPGT